MHWREVAPGPANDTELLLCALVLCGSAMSKEDLVTWANDVLVEAPRLQELGPAWKPLCPTNWSCERNKFGATVKPVHPRGGDGGARGGMHDVAAAARFRERLVTGGEFVGGAGGRVP